MKFIYSFGGHAREYHRILHEKHPDEDIIFVDDAPQTGAITYAQALALDPKRQASFSIGFADPALRRKKTNQIKADGFGLYTVQAQTAIVGENVTIGAGAVISDFAMITVDVAIGEGLQINMYSHIAHDCVIGDFVTLAPRVSVNGRVIIEDTVYIGTGATILPNRHGKPVRIGKGAVIGAHALVVGDVPAGATMVGTPAKPVQKI